METAGRIGLSLLVGYLLGSLSPAYALGRVLKGIDIRTVNFRNAGTRNVKATLGLWPAVVTGLIDTLKGIAALLISRLLIGLPEALVALPVAAAVIGHIFPFYLGLRGGSGSATAIGVFLWLTAAEIAAGRFAPLSLGALLFVALLLYLASHSGDATGLVTFLFMGLVTPLELGASGVSVLTMAISAFLFASILRKSLAHGLFRNERGIELKPWRLIARPFALLFIPVDLLWGRRGLLLLIGSVSLVFICMDLFRFVSRRKLAPLFKANEVRRFSSMTYFLISIFLGFLVFPGEIPYLGLAFTTVGDLLGKLFGIRFGGHPLYKSKTWEGTAAFFAGSIMTGYLLSLLLPISIPFLVLGAGFASAVELFSERLDDNFSVSLLTGAFLLALRYFLKI
jgi:acyl-phosphate glycerol 3-phosphate acyltransferase